nr:MAG: RNA-dependent RNA polymerase [Avian astrovirus 14]
MQPPIRTTVPDSYKLIGHIDVNRLICRKKKIKDPLLNLLEKWQQDTYDVTTWDERAYTKMFEKFEYSKPCDDIQNTYPEEWDFATKLVLDEYSYMSECQIITPLQTEKNMDSTPAFPKFLEYDTEADYISTQGWSEYIDLWNNTDRKRPLWWTFLKYETIKKEKIEQNDIRMIMCTDPTFTRFGACFDQHQNQLMKTKTEEKQAQIGWTPFYGGLDKRLKRIGVLKPQYIELDWTRYDGTIPNEVFKHIKEIRWFLHAHKYKTPENKKRYDWYVENLIVKPVLLPTGEVTIIPRGNPSGQISTTTDNNMINTFLTAFEVAYLYKKQHGTVPTIKDYRQYVDSMCYGDDRILSVSELFCQYDPTIIPEMYRTIFGMWVKPQNIKKSSTLEGLTFCGLTFTKVKGVWYGTPNVDKILSTIENPVKALPDIQSLWGKLISLRILTEHSRTEVKEYLDRQIFRVQEYSKAEKIELPEVPENFYSVIWSGGPNNNVRAETSKGSKTPQAKKRSGRQYKSEWNAHQVHTPNFSEKTST